MAETRAARSVVGSEAAPDGTVSLQAIVIFIVLTNIVGLSFLV